jgi:anti-sigma regulatory factor (Ser/Thr protein kinase)
MAAQLAEWLGWSSLPSARLDLVVAELTTNAVTHGGGGSLRLEAVRLPRAEIRLVCTDHGRKAAEPSTGLGLGLAVVTELANQFEVTSVPGGGTCVVAELWAA